MKSYPRVRHFSSQDYHPIRSVLLLLSVVNADRIAPSQVSTGTVHFARRFLRSYQRVVTHHRISTELGSVHPNRYQIQANVGVNFLTFDFVNLCGFFNTFIWNAPGSQINQSKLRKIIRPFVAQLSGVKMIFCRCNFNIEHQYFYLGCSEFRRQSVPDSHHSAK
jgi:hypothetical protein